MLFCLLLTTVFILTVFRDQCELGRSSAPRKFYIHDILYLCGLLKLSSQTNDVSPALSLLLVFTLMNDDAQWKLSDCFQFLVMFPSPNPPLEANNISSHFHLISHLPVCGRQDQHITLFTAMSNKHVNRDSRGQDKLSSLLRDIDQSTLLVQSHIKYGFCAGRKLFLSVVLKAFTCQRGL